MRGTTLVHLSMPFNSLTLSAETLNHVSTPRHVHLFRLIMLAPSHDSLNSGN